MTINDTRVTLTPETVAITSPEALASTGHVHLSSTLARGLTGTLPGLLDLLVAHTDELQEHGEFRIAAFVQCPDTGRMVADYALTPGQMVLLHMVAPGVFGRAARAAIIKTLAARPDELEANCREAGVSLGERLDTDKAA